MSELKKQIEERAWEVVEPPLEKMGYELVDIEFSKEGRRSFLRIFIDKKGGVTLDDCVNVTKFISPLLEVENVEDLIPGSYNLEVSSPGLFRELKRERDYERSIGKRVKIVTGEKIENSNTFVGILERNEEEYFILNVKGKELEIPKSIVVKINLEPDLKI